jgi:glycosyltransferase involved in cell wall biosynthesis
VRIVLWHGYLLAGTGSNIYTQAIAREWSRAGHDVVVVCQEPHPDRFDLAGAEVVRPDVGGLLPVFVIDRYEGLEPKLLVDFTGEERDRYVRANVAAVRDLLPADILFANHVVMGGPVAAGTGVRFAVKAHGSELEYALRLSPELATLAAEALSAAEAVYVGSQSVLTVLEEIVGPIQGVHEVPPGVDVDEFAPADRSDALAALLAECADDPPNPGNREERLPDADNARRLAEFFRAEGPVVAYIGKLLYNKGVHLLLEAMRGVEARLLVVGFGDYRVRLEEEAQPGTLFTGALEHRHLVHLLPLVDTVVVPSIFPEAFGMVAAEAAAAAVPPVVADHSGLAEVAAAIQAEYPPAHRRLASFPNGNALALADTLRDLLGLSPDGRAELGRRERRVAVERWSFRTVAERLLDPFRL